MYLCSVKIFRVILLSLFALTCQISLATTTLLHENDSINVDSTFVKYFYDRLENKQLGIVKIWDTTTLSASFYDPTNQLMEYHQELSNTGHAHKNMEFSFPTRIGFNDRLESYEKFIMTKDKMMYPIIYQPFTEARYMMGSKSEQHLYVLFSRQLLPRLYITLNFNIDYAPSVYIRSYAQNYYFSGNFRWNTRDARYGLNGYYITNKIDAYENGGIVYDSVFTDVVETDKSLIDVNLTNAGNLIKVSGLGLNQYFVLSKNNRLGRINHSFDFQKNSYVYSDTNPASDFYSSYDPILDSTATNDSLSFYTIKNSLNWSSLSYKEYNNDIPFYLTLGVEHNYTRHNGYTDITTGEQFGKAEYQNIRAKAGVIVNLFKSTRITGHGELILSDYHSGDFILNGQWKQFLGTFNRNIGSVAFDINLSRKSPDWFEQSYYSNNFRWDNDFSPSTYMRLKGSYEYQWLTIGLKQTVIDHYIYFGEDAKPAQHTGTVSITSAFANFDFKWKYFEIAGMASMQMTDNDNVIHLPLIYGKVKFGWNINLVKGISMLQPAVVINYFTEYYADAYMPALRTFHLQNEVKIGNYPFLDIVVTFKLKRANIFVAYTNVYSLTKDNRYFTTPHYPMRDSKIMFGIRWRMYK